MAPNNFKLDFEQIYFNLFESPDGNIFQDERDSDLNYFDELSISSKETTYINQTDIKNFRNETQRLQDIPVLHVSIRGLKTKTSAIFWIILALLSISFVF